MDPHATVAALWRAAGLPAAALGHLTLTGRDPVLPSSFRVGAAAQATIAAAALAAAELWARRGGTRQRVAVDLRHAAMEFRSERYMSLDGAPPPELWDALSGAYRCGDGRWVRVHANFPHHRDGVLRLLGCPGERAVLQAALQGWQAEAFETAAAEAGLVVAMRPDPWARPRGRSAACACWISPGSSPGRSAAGPWLPTAPRCCG
jgi:crotonobetainyl-CoA:carnitine CoA-transferase CaiB-like acyl-CoA transferase